MKKFASIFGLSLILLIAGNGCHSERHERGDLKDSSKIMRMSHGFRHHREMYGMRGTMGQGMRGRMMRGMGPGMGMGMMMANGRMPLDSIGWMTAGPGRRILESIPDVTLNQKKMIEDLIKKQQDEMKKLREEMFTKMQDIRTTSRKDILNILTDEQKKYLSH
jgi:hypothetical protein